MFDFQNQDKIIHYMNEVTMKESSFIHALKIKLLILDDIN